MFKWMKRSRRKKSGQTFEWLVFVNRVSALREADGYKKEALPVESLVAFYALKLTNLVSQKMRKKTTGVSPVSSEAKVTAAIMCTQIVHMSSGMAGLNNRSVKTMIIQKCVARIVQSADDSNRQAKAKLSAVNKEYRRLSAKHQPILASINQLGKSFLLNGQQTDLTALSEIGRQIDSVLAEVKLNSAA